MPRGYIYLKFEKVPEGTHFTAGAYSWVIESQALEYIKKGYAKQAEKSLPEDFPGREHLIKAGIKTIDDVKAVKDLDQINGIGQTTEKKIIEYLNA